ncbi:MULTISPECIES: tetratricopeptide repeat protein [Colwellia]|uniref:Sel1 repeat family protein n=1 Tax=Colwellia marinimaniae TaxID=1513592 RepID=A0ABQ0MV05_9GAMM|nr:MULTISPECIES: tetratricopeptide repeat protein [Colwellia]GAW96189.1 hypothetical protein MTCD1_01799 [Colwellia marinimaniae]
MFVNDVVIKAIHIRWPSIPQIFKLIIILAVILFGYFKFHSYQKDKIQTFKIISQPKVNDIYFLDFRLLSGKLRPQEKYRIAKVVDITGDIITLIYGGFYYLRQHAVENSIRYGHLSFKDYFEAKRYDLPIKAIKEMHQSGAIYLAKRPIRNKLFGHLVGPEKIIHGKGLFLPGKKENVYGEASLMQLYSETNLKEAFELFQRSANYGYSLGQVNLAEMYINGQHVKKDFNQALYWLKKASLQSDKPAILKYGIICKQIKSCNIVDFYQELTAFGVNIKVRNLDFKLSK